MASLVGRCPPIPADCFELGQIGGLFFEPVYAESSAHGAELDLTNHEIQSS